MSEAGTDPEQLGIDTTIYDQPERRTVSEIQDAEVRAERLWHEAATIHAEVKKARDAAKATYLSVRARYYDAANLLANAEEAYQEEVDALEEASKAQDIADEIIAANDIMTNEQLHRIESTFASLDYDTRCRFLDRAGSLIRGLSQFNECDRRAQIEERHRLAQIAEMERLNAHTMNEQGPNLETTDAVVSRQTSKENCRMVENATGLVQQNYQYDNDKLPEEHRDERAGHNDSVSGTKTTDELLRGIESVLESLSPDHRARIFKAVETSGLRLARHWQAHRPTTWRGDDELRMRVLAELKHAIEYDRALHQHREENFDRNEVAQQEQGREHRPRNKTRKERMKERRKWKRRHGQQRSRQSTQPAFNFNGRPDINAYRGGYGHDPFGAFEGPGLFMGDPRDREVAEIMGLNPYSF
ncbi:hypothetical protein OHC33_009180 [Knufia fluminis]|uniref:Uncharacterized protein n=1 Tax=Knufia fluminis TaxID=191047 RepID=A0AAN8I515_9EURO|nr:hypothetical protein OHC33_009180 [Knufia fluminis]